MIRVSENVFRALDILWDFGPREELNNAGAIRLLATPSELSQGVLAASEC